MSVLGTFQLKVMAPDKMIFDGDVTSLFLKGDTGEYEILSYHYPVLGLLKQGDIIIDWKYFIPIQKGIVRFFQTECVIMVSQGE